MEATHLPPLPHNIDAEAKAQVEEVVDDLAEVLAAFPAA